MKHFITNGFNVITISPRKRSKHLFNITFNRFTLSIPLPLKFIIKYIAYFNISRIYIEHILNWNDNIEQLIPFLQTHQAQTTLFLHDMHFRCTHPHSQVGGQYCGAAQEGFNKTQCIQCPNGGNALVKHHQGFTSIMEIAQHIVLPSRFLADFFNRFSENKFAHKVISQPIQTLCQTNMPSRSCNGKMRIAFLGVACNHKGYPQFLELAKNDALRKSYEFYVVGSKVKNKHGREFITNIQTHYRKHNIPDVLYKHNINMAFLFSQVPESYSFTMHEAKAACLPIITSTASGNIAYEINNCATYGKVFEGVQNVEQFLLQQEKVVEWLRANPKKSVYTLQLNPLFLP
jgi:hypothetical protein